MHAIFIGAVILGYCSLAGSAMALPGGSFTPPGGQAPATAPGGTQGIAGQRNVDDAVRKGQAIGTPPSYPVHRQRSHPRRMIRQSD